MPKHFHPLRWIIWGLAATFYLYEYFLRVFPSVLVPEMMSVFSINAAGVGALSAFYFYGYAAMQIPVGSMTDKYGARKLLAIAAFAAGLGTLLFAIAQNYWTAAAGRFLMGIGSSFGFVGVVYISSHWFKAKKRGIMIGLSSTIGMIGAILGQGPLEIGMNAFGWRASLLTMAVFALVLAALIYFVVRNDPPEVHKHDEARKNITEGLLSSLGIVVKNPQTWLNALMALFLFMSMATFAGLWAIPYITAKYAISAELAGFAVSMTFLGWAIGAPMIGIYSDKIQKKKIIFILANLIGLLLISGLIYVSSLPISTLFILFFLIGFTSSAEMLSFSYCIDVNPKHTKGTAIAFTNLVVVIGTVISQPFIGYLLDLNWTGQMSGNVRVFSDQTYTIAMSAFPISFLISLFLALFLKKDPVQ